MALGAEELMALLRQGGAKKPEPTPEERNAEAKREYVEAVEHAASACSNEAHRAVHAQCESLLRESFRCAVMPPAIRDRVVTAWVSLCLHSADGMEGALAKMFEGNGRVFSEVMLLCGVIAKHLGVDPAAEGDDDGGKRALPVGQYL
jgi:hypothetical protein